jgi:ABC-2 type transport system ATP-binding protein
MNEFAIRTEGLIRRYQRKRPKWWHRRTEATVPFTALDGVDLEIRQGELFGLLGSNGAGKTTLIKILTTLLAPSDGRAWVDGHDVVSEAQAIRPKINMVSGGETSGYGILNVQENLWLFSRIYGVPNHLIAERIEQMLEVVGLKDKAKTRVSHLSTGQRQKMNFCRGFITDPKILFLDEPTLGLDVTASRGIRSFIRQWMKERPERTMLLTTHYMAEADELCDRVAIIDQGKVLAIDTPSNLKRQVQQYPLFVLSLAPGEQGVADVSQISGVHQATRSETPTTVELKISLKEESAIGTVVQRIVGNGSQILTLKKVEPTLEDVFIEKVGHAINGSGNA